MSEHSGGIISDPEIKKLASLFDQWSNALDPTSIECREARVEFDTLVTRIFEERVKANFSGLAERVFSAMVRRQCRLYLQRNP